ncbi:hypothetical protein G8A07_25995 [Roseateles sp. DAIF2]|uniref:hypothetical protein n=1 Tax=Roseateles sp. DAIF2 TaxID=2714952 RepID=UPI0018A31D4A|nr:hypothetical protein [Roseateles sp. DAIF2]QPF76034.1 hypothetical protein G8A07_25995 [Roseateles sp. DAIF2]
MAHRFDKKMLAGLALGLLCCGMTAAQSIPADRAENAMPSNPRAGQVLPGPGGTVTLAAVEAAVRADAARAWRLAAPEALQVGVEELSWADGSLGCARPGVAYTQALVPGWRLIVRHQHREAVYHASQRGQWLLCPGAPGPLPPGGAAAS